MTNRLAQIGLFLIGASILIAILVPWITPDPNQFVLAHKFQPPSLQHLFGFDEDGRDLLGLVLHGTKTSVVVSLTTVLISGFVGTFIGIFAGYVGGRWDTLFILLTDAFLAFPALLLIIALAAFQRESSLSSIILILSFVGWVSYARIARGQVLSLKKREYILAAVGSGASFARLCTRHLLPNIIGPLLVNATFAMAGVILAESTLSFLGLGLPPDVPSWGRLLDQGVQYLLMAPHLSIFPGIAIALLVLSFNLLGEGLRDWFDVKEVVK